MRFLTSDFSKGSVSRNIIAQALPLTLAQLVQLLYNIVDRIYIGHLRTGGSIPLTGVGLTFPIITLIAAFTSLFGTGGTPLFSIARGKGDTQRAEKILGNVFSLLCVSSFFIIIISYIFKKPILYLFGAGDASYVYANAYIKIYLLGTVFSMLTTGLNSFINAQDFPKTGMMTIIIGAVLNIILDPIFIFAFNMGVEGAAAATVISQAVSAIWVLRFLTGKKAELKIKRENVIIVPKIVKEILSLGLSGFIMQGTNCLVQVVCNSTLQLYGGDLYVGIMTVLNSVREVLSLPVSGISGGAQPVLGYNYGAKKYDRVKNGIRFTSIIGITYTALAWLVVILFPEYIIKIFTSDADILSAGISAMHIYFFGFIFMAFQFAGQTSFQALGLAKQAIFFSLFRKAVIVFPLTILLPKFGMGVTGVFAAEPISNAIGGLSCFFTMYFTVYRKTNSLQTSENNKK